MIIGSRGIYFTDYTSANITKDVCEFKDPNGATLLIDAITLVHMYELMKFHLQKEGSWHLVDQSTNKKL
jgi:hypothetical protein